METQSFREAVVWGVTLIIPFLSSYRNMIDQCETAALLGSGYGLQTILIVADTVSIKMNRTELIWNELTTTPSKIDQTTWCSNGKCETTAAKCKKMNSVAQNDTNETSIGSSKFQPWLLKDSWLNQVLEIRAAAECLMMRTLMSAIWVVFKRWMSL